MKTAQFSLKPAATVVTAVVLRILKNAISVQINKESHTDTGYRIFSLITILFTTKLLFYSALYVGHLSQSIRQRRPLAYLGIFIAVNKRI
jgi:hypothetical protein